MYVLDKEFTWEETRKCSWSNMVQLGWGWTLLYCRNLRAAGYAGL